MNNVSNASMTTCSNHMSEIKTERKAARIQFQRCCDVGFPLSFYHLTTNDAKLCIGVFIEFRYHTSSTGFITSESGTEAGLSPDVLDSPA